MARPTKMTEQVLADLKSAFLLGATNDEAHRYAGISHETFYNYLEKHPEFREEIEAWKDEPILKAKRKIVAELDKDTRNAQWYLERKKKDEFAVRQEHTSADGDDLFNMSELTIKVVKAREDDTDNPKPETTDSA